MEHIVTGFVSFRNKVFPRHRKLFAELANGQSPEVLFITCADSRIDPNLVTQTRPGDLFIVRNAGNIVPPHGGMVGGVTASIEYAVAVLNVGHIVICGHTHCGAMTGALDPGALEDLPHVRKWLELSLAAVEVVRHAHGSIGPEQLRAVTEQNVLVQLQHLRTHPVVASRLAAGQLQLHGWMYEIESGDVYAYAEERNAFVPMAERYAAMLKPEGAAHGADV
ncbi:MAG: carbonic anhydrase [Gammaproteobacteria bacterium]|nr:carbonic anhydrase [Gammaproteobacteria bacterium]